VARLAGLPQAVIDRASEVLHLLEESERSDAHQRIVDDLPLFSVAPQRPVQKTAPAPPGAAEVLDRVRAILPDELTPREALDLLYDLKTLAASRSNG
jgi:DNA mismatch repair protein MutS